MSDISMGIERRLASFRPDVNGVLAVGFAVLGLGANLAAAAVGLVIV